MACMPWSSMCNPSFTGFSYGVDSPADLKKIAVLALLYSRFLIPLSFSFFSSHPLRSLCCFPANNSASLFL